MRGKLPRKIIVAHRFRITPADAGKTLNRSYKLTLNRDHPRGCGENRKNPKNLQEKLGSPPRMRGKPLSANGYEVGKRITPADAGKTYK